MPHSLLFLYWKTGKTAWSRTNLQEHEHIYIDLLDRLTFRSLSAYPEILSKRIEPGFQGWIVIDEVQKMPTLLDEVHRLIENQHYRFILIGSSARKLKRRDVNLLARRAIRYTMHPLISQEIGSTFQLERALKFGMLPATYTYDNPEGYLATYVETYLREEVMQEGLTRNIAAFSCFLEIASFSQGSMINASEIAQTIVSLNFLVPLNVFLTFKLNNLIVNRQVIAFQLKQSSCGPCNLRNKFAFSVGVIIWVKTTK